MTTPLRFDLRVGAGGYAWWYLDALSDDGRVGLTLIAFVGSVFSPRYAGARRSMAAGGPPADPERHCAINVALYRVGGPRVWVMSEHAEFCRTPELLRIGQSSLRWVGEDAERRLEIEIAEFETLFGARRGPPLRGRIRLTPAAMFGPRVELDRAGKHRWYPVAPHARIEVELDAPALRFSGSGYHDVNEGDEGLELGFRSWNWSRARLDDQRTAILYDVSLREDPGALLPRGWLFDVGGPTITTLAPEALGQPTALPRTTWGVSRAIRSEVGHSPRLLETFEDTPFYSRNLVATRVAGREAEAIHESLDLDRFASRFIQFLLRFKTR
jgi:carotenoid 1,2-hydratase